VIDIARTTTTDKTTTVKSGHLLLEACFL
jgi:hypothetical protein